MCSHMHTLLYTHVKASYSMSLRVLPCCNCEDQIDRHNGATIDVIAHPLVLTVLLLQGIRDGSCACAGRSWAPPLTRESSGYDLVYAPVNLYTKSKISDIYMCQLCHNF